MASLARRGLTASFLLSAALYGTAFGQSAPPASAPAPAAAAEEERKPGDLFLELFVGEKLYIQEKGEWYLIITPAFAKASDEKEFELEAEVIYGLTDELQLSAEVPYVVVNPDEGSQHQGIGDVTLAANYNFLQARDFALGVRAEFVIPTGDEDRDLGAGQFLWTPSLLGAVRVGPAEIYASVGGQFGDNHDDAFLYTVAAAYPWETLVGVLEASGASGSGGDTLYLTPGVYWNVREGLQLGLGVPIGVTDDSDDYQIIGKVSIEF
jgi:hypothetical protein